MYVGTFDLLGRSEDGRNTLQSSRVDGFILCCPSFRHFNRNRVLWERRGLSLMAADTADERYQLPLGIPMYPNAAIYYYY